MSFLFDFATKNLNLATIFNHLVAKWQLEDLVNFKPCSMARKGEEASLKLQKQRQGWPKISNTASKKKNKDEKSGKL